MCQKEAEKLVRLIGSIKNSNDGRTVEFPVNTIGKITSDLRYMKKKSNLEGKAKIIFIQWL